MPHRRRTAWPAAAAAHLASRAPAGSARRSRPPPGTPPAPAPARPSEPPARRLQQTSALFFPSQLGVPPAAGPLLNIVSAIRRALSPLDAAASGVSSKPPDLLALE